MRTEALFSYFQTLKVSIHLRVFVQLPARLIPFPTEESRPFRLLHFLAIDEWVTDKQFFFLRTSNSSKQQLVLTACGLDLLAGAEVHTARAESENDPDREDLDCKAEGRQ